MDVRVQHHATAAVHPAKEPPCTYFIVRVVGPVAGLVVRETRKIASWDVQQIPIHYTDYGFPVIRFRSYLFVIYAGLI
jgi:hypothetical protein